MSQMTLDQADQILWDVHKRAFFGRSNQLGLQPQTEKEAAALFDLSLDLVTNNQFSAGQAQNEDGYGDGPIALAKRAFDEQLESQEIAPGFSVKRASPLRPPGDLPNALKEAAYQAAYELAQDPAVYEAVLLKHAAIAEMFAQQSETQQHEDANSQA